MRFVDALPAVLTAMEIDLVERTGEAIEPSGSQLRRGFGE